MWKLAAAERVCNIAGRSFLIRKRRPKVIAIIVICALSSKLAHWFILVRANNGTQPLWTVYARGELLILDKVTQASLLVNELTYE